MTASLVGQVCVLAVAAPISGGVVWFVLTWRAPKRVFQHDQPATPPGPAHRATKSRPAFGMPAGADDQYSDELHAINVQVRREQPDFMPDQLRHTALHPVEATA